LAKPADINPTTGDITFTATTTDQVGVTDVLVKEYRNGVLIGTMIRSMQITSLDCSNKAPEISGFLPDNKDSIAVCAGQKISLQIKGSDPDGQFVKLKLLTSFPGYFKVEEDSTENPTGTFVWNTQTEDAGKYIFTVEATDNGCPEPQSKTKTFIISVLSTPQFDLGPDLNVKCDTTVKLAPKITGGDGNYKYAWNTGSTASSITVETGTYSLTVTDGKGCSTTDKIIISSGIFTQFSVAPLCFDQVTNFTDNSYSLVGNIVKWNWDFGDKSTSTDKNPTHKYAAAGQYNIKLTVTTDKNCSSTASQLVTVCKAPTPDFINLDSCTSPEPYFLSPVTFQDLTPIEENCESGTGAMAQELKIFRLTKLLILTIIIQRKD
jgi:PKD repeat protein